ncbi:putative holin-like toxin [Listeria monocytogenes]|nr:putative holin-like toxin [Listeria monocytogenes]
MPMTVSIKSLERRRLLVDISTMLQFGIFLIALIGLIVELIKLSKKKITIPTFDRVGRMVIT